MFNRKSCFYILCIFLVLTLSGCEDAVQDSTLIGIDEPIIIDGVKLTIMEAQIS